MECILEVNNLIKNFKIGNEEVEIIKNISFNIKKGEFVSIMGPSGCGKSTLLYLLGGLDKPTKGKIKIFGEDYNSFSENKKSKMRRTKLGFVFQFYNLVPNLNVEDNILLPLLLDGKNPKNYKKQLDEILNIIEMSERRYFIPGELSGGQQQRVAIARSLLFDPELILADEPIGNLDSKSGEEIMKLFRNINDKLGKTIIQVTHSQESAMYGNRIIKLKDGMIKEDTFI